MTTLEQQFYSLAPEHRRPEKRSMERALVGPARVVAELRQVAWNTLEIAVAELELPPVTIRWLAPPHLVPSAPRKPFPVGRDAVVEPIEYPQEIFLSVFAQRPVNTVLHEARHLWQWQHAGDWYPAAAPCPEPGCNYPAYDLTPEDEDRLELDAWVWAATTMRELLLAEFPRCEARGLTQ